MRKIVYSTILLLLFLTFSCTSVFASQKNVKKVALFTIKSPVVSKQSSIKNDFRQALKKRGYSEGSNLIIDEYDAGNDFNKAKSNINIIKTKKYDAVVAVGLTSAKLLQHSNYSGNVIFTFVADPVKAGLVKDIKKPGTNYTGVVSKPDIMEQFALFKEIVPGTKSLAIFYLTGGDYSEAQKSAIYANKNKLGFTNIIPVALKTQNDYLTDLLDVIEKVDAVYLSADSAFENPRVQNAIKLSTAYNKPVLASTEIPIQYGALLGVYTSYKNTIDKTGHLTSRILNGETPANIPVEHVNSLDVVLNLDTAKLLGINIPEKFIDKTTGIIEEDF